MSGLALKEYQTESLDAIARFCAEVRTAVTRRVLRPVNDAYYLETQRDFIEVPQLHGVPYFCLRVPTGGGKTLIAAQAVGTIAKHLAHNDLPLCLWVAPSTTIRDQTLRALRDRNHPYHAALREGLGGKAVEVITIEDALSAGKAKLSSAATIVVTTIQSYRIRNDRGELDDATRKVYDDNGYLMDHFTNLDAQSRAMVSDPLTGGITYSLANVFRLRGPIVIIDEAHNARTKISFDSLERFGPIAVLELTATPKQNHDPANGEYASNVLHAVSALQLKREGMIKLPIDLESRDNWLDVLARTVERRNQLEQQALDWGRASGRSIRPIALIQGQPASQKKEAHTPQVIRDKLIDPNGPFKIPENQIRIAYKQDKLGDEDLLADDCEVRYIITVEMIREGWDCPFAYVLGSVGNVATETAVEQLLGRVLRMPHAVPTGVPELDRAYAIVQSEDVAQTARSLADNMIERCGFDRMSMDDVLRVQRRPVGQALLPLSSIPVSTPPKMGLLATDIQAKVRYDTQTNTIRVLQPLTRNETQALRDTLTLPEDRAAVETYWQDEREVGTVPKQLDEYAKPFRVPQMAIRDGQRLLRFEPIELDEFDWDLDACDPKFEEADFSAKLHVGDRVVLDVTGQGVVRVGGVEQVIARQTTFLQQDENWDKLELVRTLHKELHRGGKYTGLLPAESQAWLNRVVDYLIAQRGLEIPLLVRKRHELADLVLDRITAHGRKQIRKAAELLFGGETQRRLETTLEMPFEVAEQKYAPYRRHKDTFSFRNHAFELMGEMGQEESHCAKKIDDHPNVKRWVRNLENESAGGYSLPLAPGNFFPDFLAELKDGRNAIIEYKNKKLNEAASEQHKRDVGKLWAARSNGECVFVWVVEKDWATLEIALNSVEV